MKDKPKNKKPIFLFIGKDKEPLFSKKNNLSENESLGLIDNNLIRIKKEFSEKIVLRYTPKLKFRFDYLRRQSFEVDKLIEGLSKT